jgi:hypothetical protein
MMSIVLLFGRVQRGQANRLALCLLDRGDRAAGTLVLDRGARQRSCCGVLRIQGLWQTICGLRVHMGLVFPAPVTQAQPSRDAVRAQEPPRRDRGRAVLWVRRTA